jgi:peroxiredoxin
MRTGPNGRWEGKRAAPGALFAWIPRLQDYDKSRITPCVKRKEPKMLREWTKSLTVALLAFAAACSSTSESSDGQGAAQPSASGDTRSILDLVPPPPDDANYGYEATKRDFRRGGSRFSRSYYEARRKTVDAKGAPLPPSRQFEFTETKSNTSLDRYTIEGAATGMKAQEAPATDFELYSADGATVKLSQFAGKPIVMVFTRGFPGYICPMCVSYTAHFAESYQEIKKRGAELVIVFPGPKDRLEAFVKACTSATAENGPDYLPFPVCMDADLKVVERFNLKADLSRPATFVFDGRGETQFCHLGADPSERPAVEAILQTLDGMKK